MIVVIWCCHVQVLRRDAAKRIVLAASRLLCAAAACLILFFAAGHRKSYCSDLSAVFSILAPIIFRFKSPLKKCFKINFFFACFSLWRREIPVLELQFPTPLRVVLLRFATQSLQIALQWLRKGCLVPRLHA